LLRNLGKSLKTSKNKVTNKRLFFLLQRIGILIGVWLLIKQILLAVNQINTDFVTNRLLVNGLFSFIFAIAAIFFQILAWKLIMGVVNLKISMKSVIKGYIISFLPKYIPGTVWGYISRSEWLKQEFNQNYQDSLLGSFFELVIIFFSSFFIIALFFSLNSSMLILLIPILCYIGWLFCLPIANRIFLNLKITFSRIFEISKQKTILWFESLLSGIMMWLINGISLLFLIGIFIEIQSDIYRFLVTATFAFVLAWFFGFAVFFIPSGIGIRENILALLISGFFGLNPGQSAFIAIVFRLLIFLSEGLYALVGMYFTKEKNSLYNFTFNKK